MRPIREKTLWVCPATQTANFKINWFLVVFAKSKMNQILFGTKNKNNGIKMEANSKINQIVWIN